MSLWISHNPCLYVSSASVGVPAYIQVTSAFPSSCSKPPSSRWDRALGYPAPNTGKPTMPPAVGESSSGGRGLLTARLTERLDTSLCADRAWRRGAKQRLDPVSHRHCEDLSLKEKEHGEPSAVRTLFSRVQRSHTFNLPLLPQPEGFNIQQFSCMDAYMDY